MILLPRDQLEVHLHLAARWVTLTDTDRIPGGWRGVETSAIPLSFGWRSSIFLVPKVIQTPKERFERTSPFDLDPITPGGDRE